MFQILQISAYRSHKSIDSSSQTAIRALDLLQRDRHRRTRSPCLEASRVDVSGFMRALWSKFPSFCSDHQNSHSLDVRAFQKLLKKQKKNA